MRLGIALAFMLGAWLPTAAPLTPSPGQEAPLEVLSDDQSQAPAERADTDGEDVPAAAQSASLSLGARLMSWPDGLVYGADGDLVTAFGFTLQQAREVLAPVTQQRGLSPDYRPGDLVTVPNAGAGGLVRAVVRPDLEELLGAARRAGHPLAVVSGFRSYQSQAALFEGRAQDRLAQSGGTMSLDEARARTNAGTARPGYSQHQLGTAMDLSSSEVGYRLPGFGATAAAQWLREHAGDYGFVFPYTEQGREQTGYIAEPWHVRWVGRPLAAFMLADGYLDATDVVADDYLDALDSGLNGLGL
jgi:D-alanyl-D-alanine carboxypeptidase